MPKSYFPSTVKVNANLNYPDGFTFTGFTWNFNGPTKFVYVVNMGDVNGDGYDDLGLALPCPFQGQSRPNIKIGHVMFGGNKNPINGTFDVTTFNGKNGFTIPNSFNSNKVFYSLTPLGDIDCNGFADFSIGGPVSPEANYIIRGHKGIGGNGTLDLNSLIRDGYAFAVREFTSLKDDYVFRKGDFTYWWFNKLGDVNGDGCDDFSMVAKDAYVMFGKRGLGRNGALDLLEYLYDERGGLKIYVQNGYYYSAKAPDAMTGIGDINNDTIVDFAVSKNSPYDTFDVVFGKRSLGSEYERYLVLSSSTLNGDLGFRMTHAGGKNIGFPAGDPNRDGIQDFGLAEITRNVPDYPNGLNAYTDKVIFGGRKIGASGNIDAFYIDSYKIGFSAHAPSSGKYLSSVATGDFDADGIDDIAFCGFGYGAVVLGRPGVGQRSYFYDGFNGRDAFLIQSWDAKSGASCTSVDMNGDGIQDWIFGGTNTGNFVLYGDSAVDLQKFKFTIDIGQTITVSDANFNATFFKFPNRNPSLIYNIYNLKYGNFTRVNDSKTAISTFTQGDINQRKIQFTHDGGVKASTFGFSVGSGKLTGFYSRVVPQITYLYKGPIWVNNTMNITQGERVKVTESNLGVTDKWKDANIVFNVTGSENGHYEDSEHPGVHITRFSRVKILNRTLDFVADDVPKAPKVNLTVTNGKITTKRSSTLIGYSKKPILPPDHTVRNVTIGAVGGGALLFYATSKMVNHCRNKKNVKKIMADEMKGVLGRHTEIEQGLIQPLLNKLHSRTTGFLGYRSYQETQDYFFAVERLVQDLAEAGIYLKGETDTKKKQDQFLDEVVLQIRACLVSKRKTCSMNCLFRLFQAEIKPLDIRLNSVAIAERVALKYQPEEVIRMESIAV